MCTLTFLMLNHFERSLFYIIIRFNETGFMLLGGLCLVC